MSDEKTIQIDSEEYVIRSDGEGLQVGRRNGDDVAWLDTVELDLLPGPAREALDRGDTSDEALLTALRGVTQAEAGRGGWGPPHHGSAISSRSCRCSQSATCCPRPGQDRSQCCTASARVGA